MQREAQRLAVEALRQDDGVRNTLREVFLEERGGTYALGDRSLRMALDRDYARALYARSQKEQPKEWCGVRYSPSFGMNSSAETEMSSVWAGGGVAIIFGYWAC